MSTSSEPNISLTPPVGISPYSKLSQKHLKLQGLYEDWDERLKKVGNTPFESLNGQKIIDLRVIDLKAELEKRGLPTVGNKKALVERMELALLEDANLNEGDEEKSGENVTEDENEQNVTDSSSAESPTVIEVVGDSTNADGGATSQNELQAQDFFTVVVTQDDGKEMNNDQQQTQSINIEESADTTQKVDAPASSADKEVVVVEEKQTNDNENLNPESLPNINLSSQIFEDQPDDKKISGDADADKVEDLNAEEKGEPGLETAITPIVQQDVEEEEKDGKIVDELIIVEDENELDEEAEAGNDSAAADSNKEDKIQSEDVEMAADDVEVEKNMEEGTSSTQDAENGNSDQKSGGENTGGESGDTSVEVDNSNEVGNKSQETSRPSTRGIRKRGSREDKTSSDESVMKRTQTLAVTGLSASAKASDIRNVFHSLGKITGVRIISNARSSGGSARFAHVTIDTDDDGDACIKKLDGTEFLGTTISVSKVQGTVLDFVKELNSREEGEKGDGQESGSGSGTDGKSQSEKKEEGSDENVDNASGVENTAKDGEKKKSEDAKDDGTPSEKKGSTSAEGDSKKESRKDDGRRRSSHGDHRSRRLERRDDHRPFKRRSPVRGQRAESGRFYITNRPQPYRGGRRYGDRGEQRVPVDDRIRRNREEALRREEDRRRRDYQINRQREDDERQRAVARRNQIELRELELERERLRHERERVEREKQELIRLEKLRQEAEREKIEKEKLELRRAQLKLSQKRALEAEKGRHGLAEDYPDTKKAYLIDEHSVRRDRRAEPKFEVSRRVEPARVVDDIRDSRGASGRSSGRDYSHQSTSRDSSSSYHPAAVREKQAEFLVPRTSQVPYRSSEVSGGSSRDFSSHGRSEGFRSAGGYGSSHAAATSSSHSLGQSAAAPAPGRSAWPGSSRESGSRTAAVDRASSSYGRAPAVNQPTERWPSGVGSSTTIGGAYATARRTSPSLLTQHVFNPHAGGPGHASGRGAVSGGNNTYPTSSVSSYKGSQRRY